MAAPPPAGVPQSCKFGDVLHAHVCHSLQQQESGIASERRGPASADICEMVQLSWKRSFMEALPLPVECYCSSGSVPELFYFQGNWPLSEQQETERTRQWDCGGVLKKIQQVLGKEGAGGCEESQNNPRTWVMFYPLFFFLCFIYITISLCLLDVFCYFDVMYSSIFFWCLGFCFVILF